MAKVLIIYHSMTGNTEAAAKYVADGVEQVAGCEAVVMNAGEAGENELLQCDAIAIGTPDYFSYMAGPVKDFFDRTFYPTQGKVTDKPYGLFVTHGGGGKAAQSVKDICRSFKFRLAGEPVLVTNSPDDKAAEQLRNLGKLIAESA